MPTLLAGFSGIKSIYDVEFYPNYVTINFTDVDTFALSRFRLDPENGIDDRDAVAAYFRSLAIVVGYNSHFCDDHVVHHTISTDRPECEAVFQAADNRINASRVKTPPRRRRKGERDPRYSPFLDYGEPIPGWPISLDLAQLIKKGRNFPSLKEVGLRFGYKYLRELPYPPGSVLTNSQKAEVDAYNDHDLAITRLLLQDQDENLEIRRLLGIEVDACLLNLSDGQFGTGYVVAGCQKLMNKGNSR